MTTCRYIVNNKLKIFAVCLAILVPNGDSYLAAGFLMPNSEDAQGKLRDYVMTVDDLEDLVGMDLFFSLSPSVAREVEAALPLKELGLY